MRIILFLACAIGLHAQDVQWRLSLAGMGTASAIDAASSHNGIELNPALGTSGAYSDSRGAAVKFLAWEGVAFAEWLALRHHREHMRDFTIVNWISAAALGGVAVHNWRVRGGD